MLIRFRVLVLGVLSLALLPQCSTLEGLFNEPTTQTRSGGNPSSGAEGQLRGNIVDFALKQQGAKYKYGGRSPRTGFDCSGFTYYVMENFEIPLTPVSRVQETEGQRIRLSEAAAGDLVFFRRSAAGSVFHVALVVSNDREGLRVVHSTSSRGVIIDNITHSSYWRDKLSSARRVIR